MGKFFHGKARLNLAYIVKTIFHIPAYVLGTCITRPVRKQCSYRSTITLSLPFLSSAYTLILTEGVGCTLQSQPYLRVSHIILKALNSFTVLFTEPSTNKQGKGSRGVCPGQEEQKSNNTNLAAQQNLK